MSLCICVLHACSRRRSTASRLASGLFGLATSSSKSPPARVSLIVCTKAKDSRPSPVVGVGTNDRAEFEEDGYDAESRIHDQSVLKDAATGVFRYACAQM